ncbi:GlxA family transcriptional regulator [Streptomyces sp. WAC07149]|uniref:GlxA family transcriptional regulator n=1 Tax=Streptomyces sp. WAC07149 TaxID=2487425 RepID=UPI000F77A767|nr:GlxA family transcriptional regulator [Streptomyces sp. WAC07149]RST04382.1 GlxA family transcriptional regulator [Streptomyces sp. WAC07149]
MTARLMVVVAYEAAELLDIACVTTTLAMANGIGAPEVPYQVLLAGPGGGPLVCGSGLVLGSEQSLERITGPLDTLIVSGGTGFERAAADDRLVGHVRRLARESRRVASVCTGAGVLAAAGLLDGRRATTHWRFARQLAERHPQVTVDPAPIYVRDGHVYTAAGVTSALDLTLAFIEEDHGPELARQVARDLVVYLQRPGNQEQMSLFTATPPARDDVVRALVEHIAAHPEQDLGTAALAARAGVTPRHLTRLFTQQLGLAPGRYVRRTRTEAAAQLLASTALPMERVAARCGFGSAEALRQAFTQRFGIAPSRYRAAMLPTREGRKAEGEREAV